MPVIGVGATVISCIYELRSALKSIRDEHASIFFNILSTVLLLSLVTTPECIDIETFGPPGFLNSWGGCCKGLDDEPIELLLDRCEDVPGCCGAGLAGTPSIPINRLGSSSRCLTKW